MADLTDKGLHTAVDVLVLFEARRSGKRFATLRACVGPGTNVLRANVPLKVARVRENLGTIFTFIVLSTVM